MTNDRLVSVITPCHNAAAFVGQTIESVLAQTHQPVEHLIVDDGSSDGSWAVIERFAEPHRERLRAEQVPVSRGASHARNRGAALARGEYLMFLDADDLIAPNSLGALVAALRERPDAIAYTRWRQLSPTRRGGWRVRPPGVRRPSPDPDGALRGWLEGRAWVPPCALLWPRAVFERTGGWNEQITVDDDGELMMRVLLQGVRLVHAPGGGGLYRMPGPARVSLSRSAMTAPQLRTTKKAVVDGVAAELERQGRLTEFAPAVGTAYQLVALAALQEGQPEVADECRALGARLGGRPHVSRTAVGRTLARVVGFERKERLAQALARRGIATPERLASLRRRKLRARQHPNDRER